MEKLFDALRDQHPGCEVVDVRFLVNQFLVDDQDVEALDRDLAEAVRTAKEAVLPA
jgi:hypothetical protein